MANKKQTVIDKIVALPFIQLALAFSWNYRFANNMDIPSMVEEIVRFGGVPHPLLVWVASDEFCEKHGLPKGSVIRLQGHRRSDAVAYILAHPADFSFELVQSLETVPVIFFEGTEAEAEEQVFDQGASLQASPAEVVNAIYRLFDRGFSEIEVTAKLYQQIGKILYPGDGAKVREYSELPPNSQARRDCIREWLHTKVGSYYIKAKKLGPWVAEQVLYKHKVSDKILAEGENYDLPISTGQMNKLSKAWKRDTATVDKETKEPREVTWFGPVADVAITTADDGSVKVAIEGGGLYFNELLEAMIIKEKDPGSAKEASEAIAAAEGPKMMTKKALESRSETYISEAVKGTLAVVLGSRDINLNAVDLESYRLQKVMAKLAELESACEDEGLAAFIKAIRVDKVAQVEIAAANLNIFGKAATVSS
jgi:hypothetical protein